jgi:hypothetical protein
MEIDMQLTEALDVIDINHLDAYDNSVERISLDEVTLDEYKEAAFLAGIHSYLEWFYDGEQSEFDK